MECCIMSNLERYLRRFDEIVNQMANQMLCRTSISDVTIDFCECLIPCNEGIISMCQNILQFTSNEDLRDFCNNTIQNKTDQNNELEEIKNTTYGFVNTVSDVNVYVSQYLSICRNMICRMRNCLRRGCVNLCFICQMTCCLQGVICMCENCLQCCIDPRLRTLCENTINESNEGIQNLRRIRCMICNND